MSTLESLLRQDHVVVLASLVGAVAIAWVILAASHRWRHERGWIDTLGVVLGCYWIGSALTVFSETLQTVR